MASILKNISVLEKTSLRLKKNFSISESVLILALYYFFLNNRCGRYRLSKELFLSESKTRMLMETLAENSILTPSKGRSGSNLTEIGFEICKTIFNHYKILNYNKNWKLGELSVGNINTLIAIPIKTTFSKDFDVLKLRDLIIRSGAQGATIFQLKIKNKIFLIDFYQKDFPKFSLNPNLSIPFEKFKKSLEPFFETEDKREYWLLVAGSNLTNTKKIPKKDLKFTLLATLQGIIDYGI